MTVRMSFDRYDHTGHRLEVTEEDGHIVFYLEDGRHQLSTYQLDADAAVRLAHDLLERANCDDPEVIAAIAALRLLADRNEYDLPDEPPPCDEFDWHTLA